MLGIEIKAGPRRTETHSEVKLKKPDYLAEKQLLKSQKKQLFQTQNRFDEFIKQSGERQ